MTTEASTATFSRPYVVVAILFVSALLFGQLPVWPRIVGYQFLPATDWASRVHLAAMIVGIASAVIFLVAVFVLPERTGQRFRRLRQLLGALFMSLVGFGFGYNSVLTSWPMFVAISVGHEVEIPFTVADASRKSTKWCLRPINVEGLPVGANSFCGVPEELRKTLAPGTRIAVIGRGSRLGVFATELRRID